MAKYLALAIGITLALCGFSVFRGGTAPPPIVFSLATNSPAGNDSNAGTAASPFLTPARAQTAARAAITAGRCPIVEARGGATPYFMSAALALTSADSGSGCTIRWQTYPGDSPAELSGGKLVTSSFVLCTTASVPCQAGAAGIYQTDLTSQSLTPVLDIYVNGTRYEPAASPLFPAGWTLNTNVNLTAPGSSGCSGTSLAGCTNQSEIHIRASTDFTYGDFKVASVAGTAITPAGTGFANFQAVESFGNFHPRVIQVYNAFELLTAANCQAIGATPSSTGGCFYWNRSTNLLYVLPISGVNMATATVIIPQLTTLMTGTGAHHIAFSNLILEHEASTQFDSSYGFATAFVNALCGPVPNCTSITDAGNPNMPAAITFDGASHDISFTNTAISHNADRGLWFKEGFQHASVTLNQFLDNGGGAWQFGGRNDGNQSNAALQTCCGDFENNQVDGEYQFHGVAPVAAGYYRDTVISHNALLGYGVLGTGFGFYYIPVHIGWIGAASDTPGYTANNTTNYNQVLGACQGSNQGASPNTATDCAAFHSNGAELNSFAEFNDFQHMGTSLQTCLYLDNATSNLTAEFNDCAYGGGTSGWAFINSTNGGPLLATGNTVTNNCNGLTSTGFTDFGTSNTTSPNYNYTSGSPPSTHPPTPSCTEIIAGAGVVGSPGPH